MQIDLDSLGESSALTLFARIVFTSMFWTSGIEKILNFSGTVAQVHRYGVEPAAFFAALTIFVQLVGSALVIWNGRWTWLGAGALAVFTLLTIPIAHSFWKLQGSPRTADMHLVIEHVSIVGALVLAVICMPRRPGSSMSSRLLQNKRVSGA